MEDNNSEVTLPLSDIRNKLSPLKNLVALVERGITNNNLDKMGEHIEKQIKQCKISIEYLSKGE
jgi:hypothetical protein